MKAALSNGELVYASQLTQEERHNQYTCPHCGNAVRVHKRKSGSYYFSHIPQKWNTTNESVIHETGKRHLYEWLKRYVDHVEVEPSLQTLQRPDLLVKCSMKDFAVEYQCSPISARLIKKRTEQYKSLNIHPVWIFGEKYKQLHILTPVFIQSLLFHPTFQYVLLFLDHHELTIRHHIQLSSMKRTYTYCEQRKELAQLDAYGFLTFIEQCHLLIEHKQEKQQVVVRTFTPKKIQQLRFGKHIENRLFFEALYTQGVRIDELPNHCFEYPKYGLVFKTANYIWKGYFYLFWRRKAIGEPVSLEAIVEYYLWLIHEKCIRIISKQHLSREILSLLERHTLQKQLTNHGNLYIKKLELL